MRWHGGYFGLGEFDVVLCVVCYVCDGAGLFLTCDLSRFSVVEQ